MDVLVDDAARFLFVEEGLAKREMSMVEDSGSRLVPDGMGQIHS